ncbi:MAG: succinyl-diaminopimelate desuccinylase [Demequinaceae bacterium]|nr:succinyl-diaminopimelate desuccinylase [Demequinaceae bacterium]
MALDLNQPLGDLTRSILEVESVSGNEGPLADMVEKALRALPHLEVIRDGDAIIARTRLGRDERVAIAGHLDTVPLAGGLNVRIDGDTLWGRGSVDMKGGVAVILSLAASIIEPSRDVTWILYDHEEVEDELNGLGRISRNRPDLLEVDFAVLAEPTAGRIEGGCNGTLRFKVRVPGKAAHSARAWKGVNAIHESAPVLEVLARYVPQTVTVDGLDYREGLNAVAVEAGLAGNIIPDRCTITVNYRYAPDKTGEQAIAHVHEVLGGSGVSGLDVSVVDHGVSCRPGLDLPVAQNFVDALVETGAGKPQAKVAWTDVARFGSLGIPAVNYGPGDPNLAHADDERVSIAEIETVRKGLQAWLEK